MRCWGGWLNNANIFFDEIAEIVDCVLTTPGKGYSLLDKRKEAEFAISRDKFRQFRYRLPNVVSTQKASVSCRGCPLFGCAMKLGSYAGVVITHSCFRLMVDRCVQHRSGICSIDHRSFIVGLQKSLRLQYRPRVTSSITHHSTKVERRV